ncbi:trimeric intracellular cation channel family protein [Flammeovirga yaeyamensis]|uniref:Trimeric intracellular cation channel family protein n=1 Tax=Flammeovirga yaeyamensis TaxID=367791 RepID=A0AAX1N287_9BACT|nr:trimeric intracellular cation channel family protein [Flammeovirga yaeyamensis]MBB3695993.1 putative membrane protein YeiH [Flammeovirga yaeyamensis]QWG00491.1 trimeric intracellular cation channel family protein [Flammeovirga yaeyamensis]
MEEIIYYIGVIGSFALAISGALVGMNKKLDPFGVIIVAFVTAVGGGTLRDTLLEGRDVFWIADPSYIYFILGGAFFAMIFQDKLDRFRTSLLLFDTIGLALFSVAGVQIGLSFDLPYIICVILGVITGAFGGVSRDILVNEIPVVFQKEIYATISIIGSILYIILYHFECSRLINQMIPIASIIVLRTFVVYKEVTLPSIYKNDEVVDEEEW